MLKTSSPSLILFPWQLTLFYIFCLQWNIWTPFCPLALALPDRDTHTPHTHPLWRLHTRVGWNRNIQDFPVQQAYCGSCPHTHPTLPAALHTPFVPVLDDLCVGFMSSHSYSIILPLCSRILDDSAIQQRSTSSPLPTAAKRPHPTPTLTLPAVLYVCCWTLSS